MTATRCAVFVIICTLSGCSGVFPHKIKSQNDPMLRLKVPSSNIIMVNSEGKPVDPTGNANCKNGKEIPCEGEHKLLGEYKKLNFDQYDAYIEKILQALDKKKTKKILVYIHGGLNTQLGSVTRATQLHDEIDNSSDYFPLFINWQSSLLNSYKDHLLYTRQGVDWRDTNMMGKPAGWVTSPFFLLSDITRAVVRAPMALAIQATSSMEIFSAPRENGWVGDAFPELPLAEDIAFQLLCEQDPNKSNVYDNETNLSRLNLHKNRYVKCTNTAIAPDQPYAKNENFLPIWIGNNNRQESLLDYFQYALTIPPKGLTGPVIDAFGTSSWNSMMHSLSTLFHYDKEQITHIHSTSKRNFKTTGSLSYFFKKLEEKILLETKDGENKWEIVLIGHSAGTIILNEIVKNFGELPIRTIVYMGAATTVRDYENSVLPYLVKRNQSNSGNAKVRVHHLILHEAAETGEQNILDFSPRGSLLVWIDQFLSTPLKRDDYTVGRFVNLMPAIHHTPPELRNFITITKYEAGKRGKHPHPQHHGEFDDRIRFWQPECWGPSEKGELVKDCFKPR